MRAAGSDRESARALAEMLLARPWTAQIVRVRVERIGDHRIAGITLSGVKLKRVTAPAGFLREANAIVDLALASNRALEEVDLRAVVPLRPGETVASGDLGQVTSRTVFTLTVRREAPRIREPFWDPAWRAGLGAQAANRSRVVR